jgi:beta-lactamase superfamily II metal-dependent hydrolase
MHRFISTHPDEDHIRGIAELDKQIGLWNFYCVENAATKKSHSDNFDYYCKLRDAKITITVHDIFKGVSCRWLNKSGQDENDTKDYGCAGIHFLWPEKSNSDYQKALKDAMNGNEYNNISPIIVYRLEKGLSAMWMGDMETDFIEKIRDCVDWCHVDILFAPHHGRDTAKVPEDVLKILDPKVVVIGEARSDDLNYYKGYNRILQNGAKDITFNCRTGWVDVFTSSKTYVPTDSFLKKQERYGSVSGDRYLGSFEVG